MAKDLEDGYTRIANEVLEDLAQCKNFCVKSRVVLAIIRNTWGWKGHPKKRLLSKTYLSKATGASLAMVKSALHDLVELGLINRDGSMTGYNKHWPKLSLNKSVGKTTGPGSQPCGGPGSQPKGGQDLIPLGGQDLGPKERKERKEKEIRVSPDGEAPIPAKEDITENSITKVMVDLENLTEKLYRQKIFLKAHAFKNQMLAKKINPRTILHAFARCCIHKPPESEAWGYCTQIIKVEDGNYNEREANKSF